MIFKVGDVVVTLQSGGKYAEGEMGVVVAEPRGQYSICLGVKFPRWDRPVPVFPDFLRLATPLEQLL